VESLYLLIPVSLVFIGVAIAVFFWAVNSGQYEDVEREGERILYDDDLEDAPPAPNQDSQADEGDNNGSHP
jgi:cbb3-type cytochrome oxidase maturation protein